MSNSRKSAGKATGSLLSNTNSTATGSTGNSGTH